MRMFPQGVNDAKWLEQSGGRQLATASGTGSVALWDVGLGAPCLMWSQHIGELASGHSDAGRESHLKHTRSANALATEPGGRTFASGGDDQKVRG
jgi:WD40 repeat protein